MNWQIEPVRNRVLTIPRSDVRDDLRALQKLKAHIQTLQKIYRQGVRDVIAKARAQSDLAEFLEVVDRDDGDVDVRLR